MSKQQAISIEHIPSILGVVGVDPVDFFTELYPLNPAIVN